MLDTAHELGISLWEYKILARLYSTESPDAIHSVNYILANGVHITIGSLPKGIGAAFREGDNTIVLNDDDYSFDTIPDAWGLSLVAHEAYHLEQGTALSHSKLGEMQAWQLQFRILNYFRPLTAVQQSIVDATTLGEYVALIEKNYSDYWLHNGTWGLYTYPDYPSSSLPGWLWWLRINPPPYQPEWFYWAK